MGPEGRAGERKADISILPSGTQVPWAPLAHGKEQTKAVLRKGVLKHVSGDPIKMQVLVPEVWNRGLGSCIRIPTGCLEPKVAVAMGSCCEVQGVQETSAATLLLMEHPNLDTDKLRYILDVVDQQQKKSFINLIAYNKSMCWIKTISVSSS